MVDEREHQMRQVAEAIQNLTESPLYAYRQDNGYHSVVGEGDLWAEIMFVGEAPGYKGGDLSGVPFTRDRSGVRLQQLLIELGLSHETDPRLERPRLRCFVTNVVRCNPPANRTPTRAEIALCKPYLW